MIDEENYQRLALYSSEVQNFVADIQRPVAKNILVSTTDWQKQTSFRFNGKITNRKGKINICLQVTEFKDLAGNLLPDTAANCHLCHYCHLPEYALPFTRVILKFLVLCEELCRTQKTKIPVSSPHSGRRAPFIRFGYTLSAISKPMMATFIYPLWIFFARTVERLDKEIVPAGILQSKDWVSPAKKLISCAAALESLLVSVTNHPLIQYRHGGTDGFGSYR